MSTQAILNPANLLTTPVPPAGGSQSTPASPDVPFNQVLQREMTGRRENEQPVKAPQKEKEHHSAPAQPSSGQAPSQAQKTESSDAAGNKGPDSPDEGSEELDNAAAASAELLALVTSMMQISTSQTAAPEAAAVQAAAPDLALATGMEEGIIDKLATDKLSGKADATDLTGQNPDGATRHSFAEIARNISQNPTATDKQPMPSLTAAEFGQINIQSLVSGPDQEMVAQEQASMPATSPMASMQQALNKVQSSIGADKLTPAVGTPAWDQAVGQKVVWMVAGGQQSASLTLNPPDLGPLQVVLNVNNSQANATFVAAQPEVRQALEAALPKLREMLGDAGIQLGQTSINAGHSQQGNSFSGQPQQRQPSGDSMGQDEKQASQPIQGLRQQIIKGGNGMVDTFA